MKRSSIKADAHPSGEGNLQGLAEGARASASQAEGRGFESRFPLQIYQGFASRVSSPVALLCKWLANASVAPHKPLG